MSKEQTQSARNLAKSKKYKDRLASKKEELARAKHEFEDILNERNEEVA